MFDFFNKLFRIKKKEDAGAYRGTLDITDVISAVLGQNFSLITGKQVKIRVRRLQFDSLESLPALEEKGLFYNTFSRSDAYPLSYFLPDRSYQELQSMFAHVHGEKVEKVTPMRICSWVDGNLSRLFYLEQKEDGANGETWTVVPFLTLPKSYQPDEREETLWRFSGCLPFHISAGFCEFLLFVNTKELERVESLLERNGYFRKEVRDQVMLRYTGGEVRFFDREKNIRINIEKNSEFLLGRFFIPPRPGIDGKAGHTFYRAIIAAGQPGPDTGEDFTRFRLSFNFADQVFEWYYAFRFTGLGEDRPRLKTIISGAIQFLKGVMNVHGVRGSFLNPNIYPDLSDHICIEADIFVSSQRAVCRVFIDTNFLATLAELLLPPWEIDFLKRNLFVRMLSVISLNQTLFRKNIHSFYRETSKSNETDDSGIPQVLRIAELLKLVPAEDYRRIIQNFFLARGWRVRSLQSLFFFERRPGEDEPIRIYVDSAFDSALFLAALPRARRDEWNRSLSASLSWGELKERNLRAMLDLYEAIEEDRIILSYRTRFLLKNEFQHRIDEDYSAAISEMISDRLYIDQLSELPAPVAQGVLSRFPLEQLALALIPDSSDRVILDRFISRQKQEFLDEEIDFRRVKYQSGDVRHRDVYEAMVSLRKIVKVEYGKWARNSEK